MSDPETLKKKALLFAQLSSKIASLVQKIRTQKTFWNWLESVVVNDKSSYSHLEDYDITESS